MGETGSTFAQLDVGTSDIEVLRTSAGLFTDRLTVRYRMGRQEGHHNKVARQLLLTTCFS